MPSRNVVGDVYSFSLSSPLLYFFQTYRMPILAAGSGPEEHAGMDAKRR
jgi:hypothetical protein